MKTKEYYMEQYHVLWDECLIEAGEETCDDVTALTSELFEERCKTDEVVGYYIVLYGDDALNVWRDNTEQTILSEQDKEVDAILDALYPSNGHEYRCSSCGKWCFENSYPHVVFVDPVRKRCVCEECSIDYEQKSDGRIVLRGEDDNDFKEPGKVEIHEDKFIVVKKEDVQKYLSKSDMVILNVLLGKIVEGRAEEGKSTDNKYWVVNRDEKYADKVLQIILDGERM